VFVPRDSDLEAQQLGVIPRDPKEKTTGKSRNVGYLWVYGYLSWLVVRNMAFYDFPHIGNVIIPTDELIFFRGVGIPPTSKVCHDFFQN